QCTSSLATFNAAIQPNQDYPEGGIRTARNLRRRLLRAFKSMMMSWKYAMRIDLDVRLKLATDLVALGRRAHVCAGEADNCIRHEAMKSNQRVATIDGDILFIPNIHVLRQDCMIKSAFWLYTIDSIALERLRVPDFRVWQAMAITSGNNFKGYGISKNQKILAELWSRLPSLLLMLCWQ
ncbi:hypothetical protein BGW38_000842, partial [Lunasporangiospora selenospora]